LQPVAYPGILFEGGSTNSVEDRGQRERGSGGGSPLVRDCAQFAIRFDFVKLSGCSGFLRMYFARNWEFDSALSKLRNFGRGGGVEPPNPSRYATGLGGPQSRSGRVRKFSPPPGHDLRTVHPVACHCTN
jgi:hypothetical protein